MDANRSLWKTERAKIHRVLREPVLSSREIEKIVLLRNGESAHGVIQRMCSRHSRELEKIAGDVTAPTITDMDAFPAGRRAPVGYRGITGHRRFEHGLGGESPG